ncbi:kinase-like protein [Rhizoclosmatium globosum]|uniref:Kinase-like protein n=1 Tax=Rhizoclosmatium globosum TaxID=329046 RepID=A0A1Y2C1B0_9FUNG|nr:kinase-like protein [Rhizoclosmatium globosum]|eukprot:ORY40809.1 kinase-like protein [Rhizoclosmatium globosum]
MTLLLVDLSPQTIHIQRDQVLGSGSLATVCAGELDVTSVAVKELPPGCDASLLSSFEHPHIVEMKGYLIEGGKAVAIMERMASTLQEQLPSAPSTSLSSRILWLKQIATALSYLHQLPNPVVHGDLKTSSVLIDFDGNAKLSNVGFYKLKRMYRSYRTPDSHFAFIPPECCSDPEADYTTAQDVYSFAMVMYETVFRCVPFHKARPSVIPLLVVAGKRPARPEDSSVPDWIWNLIQLCWDQDPLARPSMADVLAALEAQALEIQPIPANSGAMEQTPAPEPPSYEQVNTNDLEYLLNLTHAEPQQSSASAYRPDSSSTSASSFVVPPPTTLPPSYGQVRTDLDILWDFLPVEWKHKKKINDKPGLRRAVLRAQAPFPSTETRYMFQWNREDRLVSLILSGEKLSGTIPAEIGMLTELRELLSGFLCFHEFRKLIIGDANRDLSDNKFSGPIPEEIWTLYRLTSLNLSKNSLTGPLSANVYNLQALEKLLLNSNGLTGTVPNELGELTRLGVL